MKAQVQIHYLKRIRKNELADIQDKSRTCRHLFFIVNIYTLFSQLFWHVNKLMFPCSLVQDQDIRIWLYLLELYDTNAENITLTTKQFDFIKFLYYLQVFLLSG